MPLMMGESGQECGKPVQVLTFKAGEPDPLLAERPCRQQSGHNGRCKAK